MRSKLNINQKGIGLVETVAALGVAVIVITSLVSLALFTLRSSINSKLFVEGTKMANEEVELVRAFRDSAGITWSGAGSAGFLSTMNTNGCFSGNCYIDTSNPSLAVVSGEEVFNASTPTELKRHFKLTYPTPPSTNLVRVEVEVSWQVGANTKYSRNYTELANWKGN